GDGVDEQAAGGGATIRSGVAAPPRATDLRGTGVGGCTGRGDRARNDCGAAARAAGLSRTLRPTPGAAGRAGERGGRLRSRRADRGRRLNGRAPARSSRGAVAVIERSSTLATGRVCAPIQRVVADQIGRGLRSAAVARQSGKAAGSTIGVVPGVEGA